MTYPVKALVNPTAVDTSPNRARYFKSEMRFALGTPQTRYVETWQVGINFVIGDMAGRERLSRAELPSVEIVPTMAAGTVDEFKYTIPWTTNNLSTNPAYRFQLDTDVALDIYGAWRAFFNSEQSNLNTSNWLREIRICAMNSQNAVIAEPIVFKASGAVKGTGATTGGGLPPQVAHAITFDTESYGRGATGRIYWKRDAQTLAEFGLVSQAQRQSMSDHAVKLLTDLSSAISLPLNVDALIPCVVHRSKMQFSTITGVRVGEVTDTQRRRAKKRVENYTTTAWTMP